MVGTKKLLVCCVSWVFRVYSFWYSYYPRVSIGFPLPLLSLTFSGFRAKTPPTHLDLDDQTSYTWRESDVVNISAHQ